METKNYRVDRQCGGKLGENRIAQRFIGLALYQPRRFRPAGGTLDYRKPFRFAAPA